MKTIIVGAGEVGNYLAETLSARGNDVTVLERDEAVATLLDEHADVRVLRESGSSARALLHAGVSECDFFLALTSDDEINLVSSSLARALGARTTFARVHDATYRDSSVINYQEHFGIDFLLNPERLAAVEIAKHIRNSDRVAVENFARGQIEVQLLGVDAGSRVAGKSLAELKLNPNVRVGMVKRGDSSVVATADLVLLPGDLATVCGPPEVFFDVRSMFSSNRREESNIRVVILGGGEIGVSLLRLLTNPRFKLRVIERDLDRCRDLANRFPAVTIIHGEGTSLRLLEEEQIGDADVFVACTRDDEHNVMTCLQARKLGAKRVILAFNRADFNEVVQSSKEALGIDLAVSPRIATAAEVLRYLSNEKYIEMAQLPGDVGRLIELKVGEKSPCNGKKIRDIRWPTGCVILALQTKKGARTPGPDDEIHAGDRLVALTKPELLKEVVHLVT